MTTQAPPSNLLPLNPEQLARLQAATTDFTHSACLGFRLFLGRAESAAGAAAAARPPKFRPLR
jgi:sulfite reductase (NADPH) flavoprotein alpha-component